MKQKMNQLNVTSCDHVLRVDLQQTNLNPKLENALSVILRLIMKNIKKKIILNNII